MSFENLVVAFHDIIEPPKLWTASYVVTKSAILVEWVKIIKKKLRGHSDYAVYCGMTHVIWYQVSKTAYQHRYDGFLDELLVCLSDLKCP
jgi:hypothetical protein